MLSFRVTGALKRVFYVLIIVATAYLTGIGEWLWSKTATSLFRNLNVSVAITDLLVARNDYGTNPFCELRVVVQNLSETPITITPKAIVLTRDSVRSTFPADARPIRVDAMSHRPDTLRLSSKTFDTVLKKAHCGPSSLISFEYLLIGKPDQRRTTYCDSQIVKCTYWQTPVFESHDEAGKYADIVPLDLASPDTISVTSNGQIVTVKEGRTRVYVNSYDKSLLDPNNIEWRIDSALVSYLNLFAFARFNKKYGGLYFGRLADDTSESKVVSPSEFKMLVSDREREDLIGLDIPFDLTGVEEFVHFALDTQDSSIRFAQHEMNSRYCLYFAFEKPGGNLRAAQLLGDAGFRVYMGRALTLNRLTDVAVQLAPETKRPQLIDRFNASLQDINFAFQDDGIILFWPNAHDSAEIHRLEGLIREATGRRTIVTIEFDCRPFDNPDPEALFAQPVYMFGYFNDENRARTIMGPISFNKNGGLMFYEQDSDKFYQ